jgi:CHASE2 domain-containing sensor protein
MITLKNVLRANAASCIIFGLMFLWAPFEITLFLSTDAPAPELVLFLLGAVLVINGLHLLWASAQTSQNKLLVWYFSFGDLLWAVGSAILLIGSIWITTIPGIIATILVSTVVATLGVLQALKSKEL